MMRENKPLHVLVVTSTFPRWKGDTDPSFVFELCQKLSESGINIDVIAPHAEGAMEYEKIHEVNIYRFQYFFAKWQNLSYSGGILANLKKNALNYLLIPFFLAAQLICIYKRTKIKKYDLIHAHWIIPQGLICAVVNKLSSSRTIPLLCTSHGSDLISLQDSLSRILKSWTLSNISKLTLVSSSMKTYLQGFNYKEDNIEICPMGIDFNSTFSPVNGFDRDPNKMLYVGRLVEGKGVKYLIEALHLIKEDYPDVTLDIIGDGPERDILEKLTQEYNLCGAINFLGPLDKALLSNHYSRATIAFVPSVVQEGFGLVIVEAMACGCVVIASRSDSSREIITHELDGMLVPPGSFVDIANTFKSLQHNHSLMQSISNNARDSVKNRFDWAIIGKRYVDIITKTACNE